MSHIQSTNFVVLTGHLNDYPLADLIGILRHQRKAGRLLVEYPVGPCAFYFVEGDLVDAQLNSLSGLQAVVVALSQPNAAFNFNPLIKPPHRSITESSQKVILELLGCWEEKTIEVESSATTGNGDTQRSFPSQAGMKLIDSDIELIDADETTLLPGARELLALPPSSVAQSNGARSQRVLFMSAVVSLFVSLLTVIALTTWFNRSAASVSAPPVAGNSSSTLGNQSELIGANAQTVRVTVRVENGRVAQAFIAEPRPGLEAYEAMALKVVRGRRYPANATGQDTVLVRINAPKERAGVVDAR